MRMSAPIPKHKPSVRNDPNCDSNYVRVGVFLIVAGLVFALETHFRVHVLYRLWPLVLTIWGAGFIGIYTHRERRDAMFLGIGIYIILFSAISQYFSFAGWGAISRLWPAFIGFLGITFLLIYGFHKRQRIYLLLGMFLSSMAMVFSLVFALSWTLWWTTFVFVGVSILVGGRAK